MTAAGDAASTPRDGQPSDGGPGLVSWADTARRLRRIALVLAAVIVASFVLLSVQRGEVAWSLLGELLGLGLLAAFLIEVVVVGGTAFRGMLTAGERGERLASQDVGLLPPQVLRRARGEDSCGPHQGCELPATAQDQPDPGAGSPGPG